MSKRIKEMVIEDLAGRIRGVRDILVVDSSKLSGVAANKLRLSIRKKKFSAITVRNKLARKALHEAGLEALDPFLRGPTTLVWGGEDIVALSKQLADWVKEIQPLEIKGGATEGSGLTSKSVEALSKSPGRRELISQIAALMMSPGARLAGAMLGTGAQLVSQVKKIAEKEEQAETTTA